MSQKVVIHTIKDQAKETKKQVEELAIFLNNDWEVIETYGYKSEIFYILVKYSQDEFEEDLIDKAN